MVFLINPGINQTCKKARDESFKNKSSYQNSQYIKIAANWIA
jgi:hypothetical protein